jgi:hypothetical protein
LFLTISTRTTNWLQYFCQALVWNAHSRTLQNSVKCSHGEHPRFMAVVSYTAWRSFGRNSERPVASSSSLSAYKGVAEYIFL